MPAATLDVDFLTLELFARQGSLDEETLQSESLPDAVLLGIFENFFDNTSTLAVRNLINYRQGIEYVFAVHQVGHSG